MPQTAKHGIGYFYLKNNGESNKALKIISGTMIVFAQMFEHTQKFIALPTSRVNRKNLSENACVIKGTLISAILKTNMVTPNFFAFSDRKWIKKCHYQIWAKSYRFWKFIETAANPLKIWDPALAGLMGVI